MFGAIDVSTGTSAATDLGIAVAALGALTVTAYVGTKSFGFIKAWVGKLFQSSTGKAGS